MSFDPRSWNIIPSALLLASACQARIPVDDDGSETSPTETGESATSDTTASETGTSGETGTTDPSTTETGTTDPSGGEDDPYPYPCLDGCGPHEYCDEGACFPNVECYNHYNCDPGEFCNYEDYWQPCEPIAQVPSCDPPELVEIPLPDAAQGELLDIQFADIDGDGREEMLVLRPGELLVVHDDQSVSSEAVDALADSFAVLDANDDPILDVLVFSTEDNHAGRLLGIGDGSFMPMSSLPLPGVYGPKPVYWLGNGSQQVVALQEFGDPVVLISALGGDMPVFETLPNAVELSNVPRDAVHVRELGPDFTDHLILQRECWIQFAQVDELFDSYPVWYEDGCRSYLERAGAEAQTIITHAAGANTDLRLMTVAFEVNDFTLIPGQVVDIAGPASLGLVLVNEAETRLLTFDGFQIDCLAGLPGLPGATLVRAGDFSANPGEEFVLAGPDGVSMWAQP